MSILDIGAILVTMTALTGYANHRWLKLEPATGMLLISLVSSLAVLALYWIFPQLELVTHLQQRVSNFDFNQALMHGMLGFLLFAGALHVDLDSFVHHWREISSLATLGLLMSTGIVGALSWLVFGALGLEVSFLACLVFGSLISPTDPIAVLGLLRNLDAPEEFESLIAGESLFNDGVAVVVFSVLAAALAAASGHANAHGPGLNLPDIGMFFLREALGGALLGLVAGYIAYRLMRSIDDYQVEVTITLALVMAGYSLGWALHVSAPIAMVVSGIIVGNQGRRDAMSEIVTDYVEKFWEMIDEILNATLFMLIGIEVLVVTFSGASLAAGALMILVVLIARLVSVGLPISVLRRRRQFPPGVVRILTWGGLRGGISVALALSLPHGPERDILLTATYIVVLFSVLGQGLTMKSLMNRVS